MWGGFSSSWRISEKNHNSSFFPYTSEKEKKELARVQKERRNNSTRLVRCQKTKKRGSEMRCVRNDASSSFFPLFFFLLLLFSSCLVTFLGGEEEGDDISFGAREGLGEIHQSFLDFFSVFLHEFRVFLRNL